jgi:hypothetical protein
LIFKCDVDGIEHPLGFNLITKVYMYITIDEYKSYMPDLSELKSVNAMK